MSKGQTIDAATGIDARETFSNNNVFRQTSFRPKKGIEFEELVRASEAFRETFGNEVRELNAGAIAAELRQGVARHEDAVASALALLAKHRLPGGTVLENAIGQMKSILRGSEDNAIATFNTSHRAIKDAIRRAAELDRVLDQSCLHGLERARRSLANLWPFVSQESDVSDDLRASATSLKDLLERETFFKELSAVEQHTKAIEIEYGRRFDEALDARVSAYAAALEALTKTAGWTDIDEDQQHRLAEPFERLQKRDGEPVPIPQLRADRDACEGRLRSAIAALRRIIDGERVVTVSVGNYFAGGIETEEQLEAALDGIREECARLIGVGKKVIAS
jgi:hypothetical protein